MANPEEFSDTLRLSTMRERERILVAVELGVSRWREVVEVLASSEDRVDACARLSAEFGLDEVQATTVVDMQFRRLFRSERRRAESELADARKLIGELQQRLAEAPDQPGQAPRMASEAADRVGWWGYEPRGEP